MTLCVFFALDTFTSHRSDLGRRTVYFLALFVLIGATVAYAVTLPQVREVIDYRTRLQDYDEDRFATWAKAFELGMEYPLGVGPGQSYLILDYAPHNQYLRVFSENGVIGFLSLVTFISLTLYRAFVLSHRASNGRQRPIFALVAAAILGTLLNSLVIDTLHWRHFWLLLALGWMPLWDSSPLHAPSLIRRTGKSATASPSPRP